MAEVESGTGTKPDRDKLEGRVVGGKYLLERFISSGSSGSVYRARHSVLEKPIALKILDPELAISAEMVELFKREAKAASRLDHPNSVRILDFGSDPEGLLYIVMELVEGPDLLQVLDEQFPLEHGRVVDIMIQILGAVAQAHELGVIHRDLKPENVLVLRGKGDDGQATDIVKVCDFGVAQLSPMMTPAVTLQRTDPAHPTVIDSSVLVGTPEYMSPEQARGEPLDPRSDVYSVGMMLYQLLTRELPFEGATADEIATLQCYAPPARPSAIVYVPALLEEVCLKAIAKDPAARYQSAREMRAALRQVAQLQRRKTLPLPNGFQRSPAAPDTMSPPPAAAVEELPRRSRPGFALASTAAGVALVVAAYFVLRDPPAAQSTAAAASEAPTRSGAPPASVGAPSFHSLADSVIAPTATAPAPAPVAAEPVPAQHSRRPSRASSRAERKAALVATQPLSDVAASASAVEPAAQPVDPLAAAVPEADVSDIALGALPTRTREAPFDKAIQETQPEAPKPALVNRTPEPLRADVRIADVTVRGSVATSVVQRAIDRARARFSACYAHSANAAGRNGYGAVQVEVEFDEYGRARSAKAAGGSLPGLDRCLTEVAGKIATSSPPDTGIVKATWRVAFVK